MVDTLKIAEGLQEGEDGFPPAQAASSTKAGVEVVAVRYDGLIHDWGLLNALATFPAVRAAIAQVAGELKKRL